MRGGGGGRRAGRASPLLTTTRRRSSVRPAGLPGPTADERRRVLYELLREKRAALGYRKKAFYMPHNGGIHRTGNTDNNLI